MAGIDTIILLLSRPWFLRFNGLAAIVKRTRVKICGITSGADARVAVAAGADAIGLVFYPQSPRAVSIEQAVAICAELPPFVTIVALTVDAGQAQLEKIIEALPTAVLQFHGDETPQYCNSFCRPYIKALRMRDGIDTLAESERYAQAQALLLDTYQPGKPGGTGARFDWDMIPAVLRHRIILAGGLTAGNIERAISSVSPYAVDVSGGVEASPGIKDADKINEFIGNASRASSVE